MTASRLGGWTVVAVVALGAAAHADDTIATVTLTSVGPDRSIPVGKAFYLDAKVAPTVVYFRPVIVRTHSAAIFNRKHPTSCNEARENLPAPAEDALQNAQNGAAEGSNLYPNTENPIFVAPAWSRADPKDTDAKVLVEGNDKFFETGADYCLFVYEIDKIEKTDTSLAGKLDACVAKDAAADRTACVEALVASVPDASRALIQTAVDSTWNARRQRRVAGTAVLAILQGMQNPPDARAPFTSFVRPDPTQGMLAATSPLGSAILDLLAGHDALFPAIVQTDKARTRTHYTLDAAVQVNAIALSFDDKTVEVIQDPRSAKAPHKVLTISTETLTLPESKISLYELLRWTHGEVLVQGKYVSTGALAVKWAHLAKPDYVPTAAELATLADLHDRMVELQTTLLRALDAAGNDRSSDVVYQELGTWLRTRIESCSAASNAYAPEIAGGLCDPNASGGWPGYATLHDGGPIGELAMRIQEIEDATAAIAANPIAITTATTHVETVQSIDYQIAFTQHSWVFTYVTPVIGYAGIAKGGGWVKYAAIQIHAYPNEVDDPQWHNGFTKDLPRAFALELGLGFGGTFGPDDRYDGPGDLPVLFAGGTLHVLPYTSLTAGVAVFDRRTSALAAERPVLTAAPFIGLNVQINIPALIGELSKPTSSTTTN